MASARKGSYRVLRNPNFMRLWLGQAVSFIGNLLSAWVAFRIPEPAPVGTTSAPPTIPTMAPASTGPDESRMLAGHEAAATLEIGGVI